MNQLKEPIPLDDPSKPMEENLHGVLTREDEADCQNVGSSNEAMKETMLVLVSFSPPYE